MKEFRDRDIDRRTFLKITSGAVGAGLVGSVFGPASNAWAAKRGIVATSYGGTWQKFMMSEIIPPFQKQCDCKVTLGVGLAKEWYAKLRASGVDNPPYDVVMTNEIWAVQERREGFFTPLPIEKVPNLKDINPLCRYPDDISVIGLVQPIGLAYREDLVKNPPTSWKDLWENPEFKGKIGLYTITNSAGFMTVLMASKIFGGSEYKLDEGFAAIQKLKPFKQVDYSGTMNVMLERGEIIIGPLDAPAVGRGRRKGLKIAFCAPKEGMFMFEQTFNVTKGSKNKDLAFAYVNYVLSPEAQSKWMNKYLLAPANMKVKIPPELQEYIPIYGDRIKEITKWDFTAAMDRKPYMVEKWNKEM
ncbi:MAG: extracellular solute-binding protein [Deltaproteobacteria bacterium]|nr:extracellular solute-binding protein [Deltaproteobacteria bacterium]